MWISCYSTIILFTEGNNQNIHNLSYTGTGFTSKYKTKVVIQLSSLYWKMKNKCNNIKQ